MRDSWRYTGVDHGQTTFEQHPCASITSVDKAPPRLCQVPDRAQRVLHDRLHRRLGGVRAGEVRGLPLPAVAVRASPSGRGGAEHTEGGAGMKTLLHRHTFWKGVAALITISVVAVSLLAPYASLAGISEISAGHPPPQNS